MAIPAPYIPQINIPTAAPPQAVTAGDVLNVLHAQEQLSAARDRNRLQAMISEDEQADRNVNRLAAQQWLATPPPAPPSGPQFTPAPAAPVEQPFERRLPGAEFQTPVGNIRGESVAPEASMAPVIADPAGVHDLFTRDKADTTTPDPKEDQTDKYAVTIPGRASRTWLMEQARAGKIDPQAALRYDTETQALVQEQTALYEKQGVAYGEMVKEESDRYKEEGKAGMPKLKALAERMKKDLVGNPLAQQRADYILKGIEEGIVFGPGQSMVVPSIVTEDNKQALTEKLKPFMGPEFVPVVGETYSFKVKNGKIVAAEASTAVAKEGTSLDAKEVALRTKELVAKGMPRDKAELKVISDMRKEKNDAQRANYTFKVEKSAEVKNAYDEKRAAKLEKHGFSSWKSDDKEFWFETTKATGKEPNFGWGKAAAKNREDYSHQYGQWLKGQGISGQQARATAEEFKANVKSFSKQTFNRDMMKSFIENIDAQIDRWGQITKDVARYDSRLANVPLRQLRKKIIGTPYENEMELYITEISSEAARLASGNAQSIAQMTDANIKHWQDIHDENLSIADMAKLLKETKNAGAIRLKSVTDVKKETLDQMKGKPAQSKSYAVGGIYQNKKITDVHRTGGVVDKIKLADGSVVEVQ